MADDLDFSSMDEGDDIDWSDVEAELQENRNMIKSEAGVGGDSDGDDAFAALMGGGGGGDDMAGGQGVSGPSDVSLDFLMDIPLEIVVEVGDTELLIKELLALDIGSIIELKKNVGAPLNIKINEKLVAKGEIVIQHEKFAIKIVEILDEHGRLQSLM